jgi:hypothetical protein
MYLFIEIVKNPEAAWKIHRFKLRKKTAGTKLEIPAVANINNFS